MVRCNRCRLHKQENIITVKGERGMEEKKLPAYETPKVLTYTDADILEEVGPAQTGYVKDSAF